MFCPWCGAHNSDMGLRCVDCGKLLPPAPQAQRAGGPTPIEQQLKGVIPVNTSVLAIIAGYAGLFSLLLLPGPIALLLGIAALIDLRARPGRYGHVRAWFAVIAGGLATAAFILILASAASGP
jgi:hypothetical protein